MGKAILINTLITLGVAWTMPEDPTTATGLQRWITFPLAIGCTLGWFIIIVEGFGRIVGGTCIAVSEGLGNAIDDVRRGA